MENKKCKTCNGVFNRAEFPVHHQGKIDGSRSYYSQCKPCKKESDLKRIRSYRRECKTCKKEKSYNAFPDTKGSECKACMKELKREYFKKPSCHNIFLSRW